MLTGSLLTLRPRTRSGWRMARRPDLVAPVLAAAGARGGDRSPQRSARSARPRGDRRSIAEPSNPSHTVVAGGFSAAVAGVAAACPALGAGTARRWVGLLPGSAPGGAVRKSDHKRPRRSRRTVGRGIGPAGHGDRSGIRRRRGAGPAELRNHRHSRFGASPATTTTTPQEMSLETLRPWIEVAGARTGST